MGVSKIKLKPFLTGIPELGRELPASGPPEPAGLQCLGRREGARERQLESAGVLKVSRIQDVPSEDVTKKLENFN